MSPIELTKEEMDAVENNGRIAGIKLVRDRLGLGLKECVDAVDHYLSTKPDDGMRPIRIFFGLPLNAPFSEIMHRLQSQKAELEAMHKDYNKLKEAVIKSLSLLTEQVNWGPVA